MCWCGVVAGVAVGVVNVAGGRGATRLFFFRLAFEKVISGSKFAEI